MSAYGLIHFRVLGPCAGWLPGNMMRAADSAVLHVQNQPGGLHA